MRVIDEKGKLFGKINIIDFLVILLVLCILPAFYLGYQIMTKRPTEEVSKGEFIETETHCQFIKLEPRVLKNISVGDKELDENGQVLGEIIALGQSEPYKYKLDIGRGQTITKEDKILKQIEAKLRLKAEIRQDNLYYKDRLLRIDSPLRLETNKYSLIAVLTEVERETVTAILKVKFSNLTPELTKVVKSGDRQIEIVKTNIKRIVAKIVNVISNEPAEVISLTPDGKQWSIVGHPKNRDLVLEIETLCIYKPEGLFLKDKAVKIGKAFEFSTDLYSISGIVIEIETK